MAGLNDFSQCVQECTDRLAAAGINASFADGSSQFISADIDPDLWRLLGNRADGEIVKPF